MTKNKFMKHIEKAHKKVDRYHLGEGCCYALESLDVYHLFSSILEPIDSCGIDGEYYYWLGRITKENIPLRHHFIDTFAGIILADKGYKDLEKYCVNEGWLK